MSQNATKWPETNFTKRSEKPWKVLVGKLQMIEIPRTLYLAMPVDVYEEFGGESIVSAVFTTYQFKILLYEPNTQIIASWIN